MGEVLKFVTLDGGLRKNAKKVFFCKNNSNLRPFLFKFRFERRTVLRSAKRAQNKHKNRWRAQAKLSDDVLSNDIMQRPKNEVTIF